MIGVPRVATVTIAASGNLSSATFIGGRVHRLLVPTIDAAKLSFQVSDDGTTFYDLYDGDATGAEVQIVSSTGARAFRLSGDDWKAVQYLKVRSGLTAATTTQNAARVIKIVHTS